MDFALCFACAEEPCRVFTSVHAVGRYPSDSVAGVSLAAQFSIGNGFAAIESFAGNAIVSLKNVERRI